MNTQNMAETLAHRLGNSNKPSQRKLGEALMRYKHAVVDYALRGMKRESEREAIDRELEQAEAQIKRLLGIM